MTKKSIEIIELYALKKKKKYETNRVHTTELQPKFKHKTKSTNTRIFDDTGERL